MGGKQRTAKEKKASKHRCRKRHNAQPALSGSSNEFERNPAEDCQEVHEVVKRDMKRLFELKFAYLENAVETGKIRPRIYNPEDINCTQSMREERILEVAVEMEKKTFTKMARELLAQYAEGSTVIFRTVQNVLVESVFLIEVQLDISKMDMMIVALRKAADKKEKEKKVSSQRRNSRKMKKLKVNC